MLISLTSPVYNESNVIEEFVRRSAAALARMSEDFEIVLVNDASTDDTERILLDLKSEIPQLRIIHLSKNSGQHAATVVGLKHARGECVFIMDSDLQVSPEDMQKLYDLSRHHNHWDIISGCRNRRSESIIRSFGSRAVSKIINILTRTQMKDPGSTFLLMTRNAVDKICGYDVFAQNLQILMGFLGFRILDTPVEYHDNKSRKSSYRISDLIELLVVALLNFTTGRKMLIVLLLSGFFLVLFGSCSVLFLILQGVVKQSVLPTNYLLFFSFLLLVGLQFIFLSIIAYKIERVNRNLAFRKTLHREIDD